MSLGGVSFPDVLLIPKRPSEHSKSDSGRSRSGVWNSRPDIESFHRRRLNDCSTLAIDDCKQAPPVATSEDVNIQSSPRYSSDAMTPNTGSSFTYENREYKADQNDPLNEPPAPLDPGTEKMVYPAYSVAGSSEPEKTMSHPTEDGRLLIDPQRHSSAPIGKVSTDREFFDTQKPETGMTKHSDQDNRAMDRSNDPALTPLKMPIENKDDNISCAGGFCMVKANSPIYTPHSPSIHGVVSPIYTPLSPPKYAQNN
ncbi:hypothetical protein N7450_011430 [Penicillium hetheringtonii]|uniref:Uncharacterized protein n=1 Tax=Penicillium hetheringtonii TaxID=911720 RepID=A0AAD6D9W9_9EURO|nr:hypothetical protein N7450_011430 [Penicillium hetheringtonii]